ncbi:MAG: T9SS type A sorting domain-containing protein [Lewinellaceae bacterium]|nr:T9SS type A sorting domain-containing protein [Lewinellaceae bacterium]
MKYIATLLIFVFPLFNGSAWSQQWERIYMPDNPSATFLKMAVVQGTPFAVFYDGLYRGNDGGAQWEKIRHADILSTGYYFFEANFENGHIYFNSSIDSSGLFPIYESPDLGKTWTKLNLFPTLSNGFGDLAFIGDTLYTIQSYSIYKIFGAGQIPVIMPNWPSDTAGLIYDIAAYANDLWVVAQKGLYHSPDAGYTWRHCVKRNVAHGVPYPPYVFPLKEKVFFYDKNINPVFYSPDRGDTWVEIPWTNSTIFSTGEQLYTIDAGQKEYLLRIDDDPFNGDTIPIDALQYLSIKGVGEFDKTIWIGSAKFGIAKKSEDDNSWQFRNKGLIPGTSAMSYNSGYLFSGSVPIAFSADNGDTWSQRFDERYVHYPSRKDNSYIGLFQGSSYAQVLHCPANNRFEWEFLYHLPKSSIATFSTSITGDSVVISTNPTSYEVYRSLDRGQTWENISDKIKGPVHFHQGRLYGMKDYDCVFSDDAGTTWTPLFKFPVWMHPSRFKFHLYGDTFLVTYPNLNRLYYSANGGLSFDTLPIPGGSTSKILDIQVIGKHLFLSNDNNEIYISEDGGQTWPVLPRTEPGKPFVKGHLGRFLTGSEDILFVPGYRLRLDQFRQVSGTVFLDSNNSGQQEYPEAGLNGQMVQSAQTGALSATYKDGHFYMLLSKATADTIRITNVPKYYSASPVFKLVPAGQTAQPVQFALRPQGQINDAAVSVVPTSVFRGGYTNSLQVQVENQGTIPLSGQLKLVLDPQLEQLSFEPMADAQIGDTLVWEYSNLKPLQTRKFRADVRTAVVPPGTPVQVFAQTQNGPDVDESNNAFLLDAKVQSSYDPNDKAVSHETVPVAQLSESELLYTIRFQNLGNIATDFITIRDTLSAAIDPSSIRVLRSSHKYSWSMEDGHILVFSFNPIALAPAGVDSLRSQGFVQFAARLRDDLQAGADIANTAHIYFDFNPAVVTNTVHTVIQTVATLEPAKEALRLEVFPNPAREQVTLRLPEGFDKVAGRIEIFDTNGKLRLFRQTQSNMETINASDLSSGSYWCRWQQGQRSFWGKLIVVR